MTQPTRTLPPMTSCTSEEAVGVQCSHPKCARPARSKGMCNRCYQRWLKVTPRELRPEPTPVERFLLMVNREGPTPQHAPHLGKCWLWTGSKRPPGYGAFNAGPSRGNIPAHGFALEMAGFGPCPDGLETCHRCDTPSCVRPSHVYYGTRQQNMDDAWHRSRQPVGSERNAARLVEGEIEEIRHRFANGERCIDLARVFGVSQSHISHITRGKAWPNAGGPITKLRRDEVNE